MKAGMKPGQAWTGGKGGADRPEGRPRLRKGQVKLARRLGMIRLRDAGHGLVFIGLVMNLSQRHVERELAKGYPAEISPEAAAFVERMFRPELLAEGGGAT